MPHMYQTVVRWQPAGQVDIDGRRYEAGKADGLDCNCLIDSLRQVLGFAEDVEACMQVREKLRQKFSRRDASFVGQSTFLDAHEHWEDVVRYWAEVAVSEVSPEDLTVTCLSCCCLLPSSSCHPVGSLREPQSKYPDHLDLPDLPDRPA